MSNVFENGHMSVQTMASQETEFSFRSGTSPNSVRLQHSFKKIRRKSEADTVFSIETQLESEESTYRITDLSNPDEIKQHVELSDIGTPAT